MRTRHAAVWLVVLCLLPAGCQSAGQTTALRHSDLNTATSAMAQSLAASDFLRDRTPDSPPIIVIINKVTNLTSDIIPPAEQWMLMARLQGSLPIRELGRQKNITFQIPPERELLVREAGYDGPLVSAPVPTHVMSAVFRSATRTVREKDTGPVNRRLEYYYLEYQITGVQSRQVHWTDAFEFKREAVGVQID